MDMVEELAALKESVKSAHIRINNNDKITDSIHNIAERMAVMQASLKNLEETLGKAVTDLDLRIKKLEEKPARRLETITTQMLALIIAAVFGLVMGRIGLL